MRIRGPKARAYFEFELGADYENLIEDYIELNEYIADNPEQEIWYFGFVPECNILQIIIGDIRENV